MKIRKTVLPQSIQDNMEARLLANSSEWPALWHNVYTSKSLLEGN